MRRFKIYLSVLLIFVLCLCPLALSFLDISHIGVDAASNYTAYFYSNEELVDAQIVNNSHVDTTAQAGNNLLKNSDFRKYTQTEYILSNNSDIFPNWFWISNNIYTTTITKVTNGISFVTDSSSANSTTVLYKYIRQPLDFNLFKGQNITFSISMNNIVYSHTFTVLDSFPNNYYTDCYFNFCDMKYQFRLEYNNALFINILFRQPTGVGSATSDGIINWVKLEYGDTPTSNYPIQDVMNNEKFLGWSVDNKNIVDLSTYNIKNNTIFTAIYGEKYNNTYNYTAEISEDYDTAFLNGIKSIESVSFDYQMYIMYEYVGGVPFNFKINSSQELPVVYDYTYTYFSLNLSNKEPVNYFYKDCFNCNVGVYGSFVLSDVVYDNLIYKYTLSGVMDRVIVADLYLNGFSTAGELYGVGTFDGSSINVGYTHPRHVEYTGQKLSQFLDMNSTTNYEFGFSTLVDNFGYSNNIDSLNFIDYLDAVSNNKNTSINNPYVFFSGLLQDNDKGLGTVSFLIARGNVSDVLNIDTNFLNYSFSTFYDNNYTLTEVNITKKIIIKNFEIKVNRPVNRTENTLVIYNYDYDCAISNISSVEYALSKDNDLYVATYNGSVPNSTFLGFTCAELQNRIYDEYIYIYLTFNGNIIDFSTKSGFALGFDFNFSKFYEPLVIEDIDMYDDLPIPALNKPKNWYNFAGWIMYAFVWVLFYNPIVKPVTSLLFPFINILISAFGLFFSFPFGKFIIGYIGFMCVYKLLTGVLNLNSAKVIFNSTTNLVTGKTFRNKERKKLDKFNKKQHYEQLRYKANAGKRYKVQQKRYAKNKKTRLINTGEED